MRARFRKSFEKPEPVVPDEVNEYTIDLHWSHHCFRKGHKIMVQVQSTWFPLIDRNPQKYVPNIFEAKDVGLPEGHPARLSNARIPLACEHAGAGEQGGRSRGTLIRAEAWLATHNPGVPHGDSGSRSSKPAAALGQLLLLILQAEQAFLVASNGPVHFVQLPGDLAPTPFLGDPCLALARSVHDSSLSTRETAAFLPPGES